MKNDLSKLIEAENKAAILFEEIQNKKLIIEGKSEKDLNSEIFNLALELFNIKKYWHKRIVRAGKNTLVPYQENPPDLILQGDDILFLDFGPVFDEWEADFGRTYVIGSNEKKLKLKQDVELAWHEGKKYFIEHKDQITGAEFYNFTCELAKKYGWEYGNEHGGHLVGHFPHETIIGEDRINYIHPENTLLMCNKDPFGKDRHWIYEIHFIDSKMEIGGFFEQLMF